MSLVKFSLPECSFVNWQESLLDTCCTGTNERTINHNINDFKSITLRLTLRFL